MGGRCPQADCTVLANPANPFASGGRGFDRLTVPRLRALLVRYRGFLTRLDSEGSIWPDPTTARLYCGAIVAEIEGELAARDATDAGPQLVDPSQLAATGASRDQ